jgi:glycosyltransferase involved in cell wall biosynthesis
MLHEHDVADTVRLMGPRTHDELLSLYAGYDAFLFPTWSREPFGFAPLEAASAGCVPVITADCGYAEWFIDELDCLKAPRTPDAFAERLAEVLDGRIDLGALGRRAQAVVWREFHISGPARRVQELLAEAAGERRPPSRSRHEFFALARFAEGLIQVLAREATAQ